MKTLTSMTDFVLEIEQNTPKATNFSSFTAIANYEKEMYSKIIFYAKFLKQPLAIYQFVPCKLVDGEWVVLEEPEEYKEYLNLRLLDSFNKIKELGKCALYQEALDKVLFEGFEVKKRKCNDSVFEYIENGLIAIFYFNSKNNKFQPNTDYKTIEDLVRYDLTLTKTALKEIGL